MTSTAPAAGSTPASKNLIARYIGMIVAPKDTYLGVVAVLVQIGYGMPGSELDT